MGGERAERATLVGLRDQVIEALIERVEVETVEERPGNIVLITIRLPEGMTEHQLLAMQECVHLQLIALEGAHTRDVIVYVPRYI